MSTVMAEMSMSLDGYVADLGDGVDALHAWYVSGDVETRRAQPDSRFALRQEAPKSCAT
ncbi:MAG: hypothetical protein WAL22_16880 [Solirubrobacteraceae bacterium]